MIKHNNHRKREENYKNLKIMIDAREQLRKLSNSSGNRILAMKRRTDDLDKDTLKWLEEKLEETNSKLKKLDRKITKHIKDHMMFPIVEKAIAIKGLGFITIAYMLIYVDIKKARYASSLWSYVGLDKPSHKRYTKNVAGGGNKTLRTALYTMAKSMVRTRAVYRDVYDREKQKLSMSEKLVETRTVKKEIKTKMWKDVSKGEGLPTAALYVEEKLGHKEIVRPEERGWEI